MIKHLGVTSEDRWDRWCRKSCDWDANIHVGAMIQLEDNEHLVVGRLRGVVQCKGLGNVIDRASERLQSIAWGFRTMKNDDTGGDDSDAPVIPKKRKRRINVLAGPSTHPTALQVTLANAQETKRKERVALAKVRTSGMVDVIDLTREGSLSTICMSD